MVERGVAVILKERAKPVMVVIPREAKPTEGSLSAEAVPLSPLAAASNLGSRTTRNGRNTAE
jgi:hypothetical protein